MTWIELYSLVDHFTIIPTFLGIYYDRNWLGQSPSPAQFVAFLHVRIPLKRRT